jgi:Fe-S-cluster containining protein
MAKKKLPRSEPWYAAGLRFTCTGCGNCCRGPESGYVYVDEEEIEAMAEALEVTVEVFGRRYLRRLSDGRISLTENKGDKDCVLWREGVGCEVYEQRPTQCRSYPFWPELLESQISWEAESEECPGVGKGRRYTRKQIDTIMEGGGTRKGPGNSG